MSLLLTLLDPAAEQNDQVVSNGLVPSLVTYSITCIQS